MSTGKTTYGYLSIVLIGIFTILTLNAATCKYSFKDTSPIPTEIKNFRVNYFENKAEYINTQLSPQLTEKIKQKIISTTRLRQTNADEADYDISGFVSRYNITTISISGANSSGNRLTVGFHLVFKNNRDEKKNFEAELTRTFDFDANLSLSQAEVSLNDEIIKNITDEIFNKIFSNW